MENNPFQTREPSILGNPQLRTPQREAFERLAEFAVGADDGEREVGIVLPVGCGKSGCITLAPFAIRLSRDAHAGRCARGENRPAASRRFRSSAARHILHEVQDFGWPTLSRTG